MKNINIYSMESTTDENKENAKQPLENIYNLPFFQNMKNHLLATVEQEDTEQEIANPSEILDKLSSVYKDKNETCSLLDQHIKQYIENHEYLSDAIKSKKRKKINKIKNTNKASDLISFGLATLNHRNMMYILQQWIYYIENIQIIANQENNNYTITLGTDEITYSDTEIADAKLLFGIDDHLTFFINIILIWLSWDYIKHISKDINQYEKSIEEKYLMSNTLTPFECYKKYYSQFYIAQNLLLLFYITIIQKESVEQDITSIIVSNILHSFHPTYCGLFINTYITMVNGSLMAEKQHNKKVNLGVMKEIQNMVITRFYMKENSEFEPHSQRIWYYSTHTIIHLLKYIIPIIKKSIQEQELEQN